MFVTCGDCRNKGCQDVFFLWFCYAFNTMGRYDLDTGDLPVRFHLRKGLRKLYDG